MFILTQCVNHPSFSSTSRGWIFAAAAYAICWAVSTVGIWLGWELGYEFWRRWRLPRPAIEPIYLSLPATIHLSLGSFHHFVFLAHIRLSPFGTAHAWDIVPETCYALLQLLPGLIPLLPRAAIAVVLLTSYDRHTSNLQMPFGANDRVRLRDKHFFRSDNPSQLTFYAKSVLYAHVIWVCLRLTAITMSGVLLWLFADHPLGKLTGNRFSGKSPTTPRPSSFHPRDPSQTSSPQKSWQSAENDFQWAWRDRTRGRIQEAFELCMIRRGKANARGEGSRIHLPVISRGMSKGPVRTVRATTAAQSYWKSAPSLQTRQTEQGSDPKQSSSEVLRPPSSASRIASFHNPSTSTQDVFYTPPETPARTVSGVRLSNSEFDAIRRSTQSKNSVTDVSAALTSQCSTDRDHRDDRSMQSHAPSSHLSMVRQVVSSASVHASGALSRARSTSVSLLRESIDNGMVKRAHSGTLLGIDSKYSKVRRDDEYLQEFLRES